MRSSRTRLAAAIAAATLMASCGGEQRPDNAVEAREGNVVELAGVRYRVTLFRELNIRTEPDDALWTAEPPPARTGLYVVSLEACGVADESARATGDIHLEDAFGQRFEPQRAGTADAYEYNGSTLPEGRCTPSDNSPADDTFGGAALVFSVPFDATRERPMVLVLGDTAGGKSAKVQLDL